MLVGLKGSKGKMLKCRVRGELNGIFLQFELGLEMD